MKKTAKTAKTTKQKEPKKFSVYVTFDGGMNFEVEARTKGEAEEKALEMWDDVYSDEIADAIHTVEVSDCYEADR